MRFRTNELVLLAYYIAAINIRPPILMNDNVTGLGKRSDF